MGRGNRRWGEWACGEFVGGRGVFGEVNVILWRKGVWGGMPVDNRWHLGRGGFGEAA